MMPERAQLLREMGLTPLWKLRARSPATDDLPGENEVSAPAGRPDPLVATSSTRPPDRDMPGGVRPSPSDAPRAPGGEAERAARIAQMNWEELEADIRACTACRLCEQRKLAVPGSGDRDAAWMLVGEGPGAEEDKRGLPFVGAAGKLLDAMLGALGLNRDSGVYIANTVKCRPPLNRTPESDEIATCRPYLERQIELVGPELIVALGRPAAQTLLDDEVRISAARGRKFAYNGVPVVVTYHPAYLLRNQADKAKAWEDLCFARSVSRPASGREEG